MAEKDTKSQYEYEYKKDYQEDWDAHRRYVSTLDPLEAMLLGQVYDSVSNSVDGSKITDSYTATLAIERAARVMGKLPDGLTEGAKGDQGKAAFMDILRQKWIYPNASSQFPFETKMEMAQLYSDVYGYFPVFYDWNVNPNGYVGPDCWLWSPRNLVFQQGRNFFKDMDYVTALTWVGASFIEEILEKNDQSADDDEEEAGTARSDKVSNTETGGWDLDALKELLGFAKRETNQSDEEQNTRTERTRQPGGVKKGICLATRYEAGDDGQWITFAPDHGFVEVRRLDNPHKNGRIPFRIKYSQELYDSVYGLGDFARSKPLQFARDGLTNFYFKGIKMNLIPPIVVNANGVLKHTIDYREGGVMMETIPNSVRRLETSNAGLATFQAAQSNLTGSLLSLWGSQNASMPGAETLNPTQGKTPAAISLYEGKEADRDGRARKRIENLIEELTDAFFSLIANIGTETVPVNLYAKDIEAINDAGMTDIKELFQNFTPNSTFTGGQLKINQSKLKGVEFKFNINPGSTAKVNEQEQLQQLEAIMTDLAKFQNQFKDDPSISINWAEVMKLRANLSNLPGAAKFVTIKSPEEVAQAQQQAAEAQAALAKQNAKDPVESMNYKDVPEDIKRQFEQKAGFQPSNMTSPAGSAQEAARANILAGAEKTRLAQNDHALKVATATADAINNDRSHDLSVAQAVSGENQANRQFEADKNRPKPKAK